jgi:hypothetical protein
MSRAMNVALGEDDVRALCDKAGVAISVLETLPQGGTRLVCRLSEGADTMRGKLAKNLIDGDVKRFRFYRTYNY